MQRLQRSKREEMENGSVQNQLGLRKMSSERLQTLTLAVHVLRLRSPARPNSPHGVSRALTQTSASGGGELEAVGAQAGEAPLGVGARPKRADLRRLGALVDI